MTVELPVPPNDYSYEVTEFKRNLVAIWLVCHRKFDYNLGEQTRTIWGFYNTKKKQYHAPVNSKQVGDVVMLDNTTPYTAMPLLKTTLSSA